MSIGPGLIGTVVVDLDAHDVGARRDVQGRVVGAVLHPAHPRRSALEVDALDLVERGRGAERDTLRIGHGDDRHRAIAQGHPGERPVVDVTLEGRTHVVVHPAREDDLVVACS